MQKPLSPSAQKVQDFLAERGYTLEVVELPDSTRTAVEAANAIGVQVGQIVKSLVFKAKRSEQAVLVIASGANRVKEKRVADELGEPLGKADADFVRAATGYAIGGIPPIAHDNPLPVFIDQDLLQYDFVWAAAGTPHAVFRLDPKQLEGMTGGKVITIT